MAVPAGAPAAPGGDLARRVSNLIQLHRKPDGTEYNNSEIAEGVSDLYRKTRLEEVAAAMADSPQEEREAALQAIRDKRPLIHRTYVGDLLQGKKSNPSMDVLQALATWFGVPASYFFPGGEGDQVAAEVELLKALKTWSANGQMPVVETLMRTTGDLSPSATAHVLKLVITAAQTARALRDDTVSDDS